jgi:hypothetical protein
VALRAVLEQLRRCNIKVHPKKIRILFPEVAFLGHMVNPIGLKPQKLKVAAIQRIPYQRHRHEATPRHHQLLQEVLEGLQPDCAALERPIGEGD